MSHNQERAGTPDHGTSVAMHEFANGIKVPSEPLLPEQLERYETEASGNIHEPEEEEWFDRILSQAQDAGVFVDVGAAIGYYAALVLKRKPQWHIYALEPNPEMRIYIGETLRLNEIDPNKVTVIPKALYGKTGSVPFLKQSFGSVIMDSVAPKQVSNGLFAQLRRPLAKLFGARPVDEVEDEAFHVPAISFQDLTQEIGAPIDLIKIDIQGLERELVPAMKATLASGAVRWIIVGTHGDAAHDACIDALHEHFEIIDDRREVPGQPDGMIVARYASK